MALITAGIALASAGATAYSANQSKKASDKASDDADAQLRRQTEEARTLRAKNAKVANWTRNRILKISNSYGDISKYLDKGEDLASDLRDDRIDYLLGDSLDDVRGAQEKNAAMANFDFSSIIGDASKLLRAGTFDIASVSRDMPTGSFANLSVANMANLAQQGLSNTIGIGDFLSRMSGIDAYNQYTIAGDLFTAARDKAQTRIQAQTNRASMITANNTNWFQNFSKISNDSMIVSANRAATQIRANDAYTTAATGLLTSLGGQYKDYRAENAKYANAPKAVAVPE